MKLTKATRETLIMYAEELARWDGTPWVSAGEIRPTKAQRGNLADLVKKGLIKIIDNERKGRTEDMWILFTEAGAVVAKGYGIDIPEERIE